jgi:hypothetical protein
LSEHVFKKEVFLKYRFISYPSAFYSDDRALLDLSVEKPIYTINKAIVYIRISDFSMSGTVTAETLQKAGLQFLHFIYNKKFSSFNRTNKLLVLNRFENSLIENEVKSIFIWIRLYLSYLYTFDKVQFVKFNKKLLRKLIVKKTI